MRLLQSIRKLSGGFLEVALGAFVVGLLIAASHYGNGNAMSANAASSPTTVAAVQQIPGGTLCIVDDSNLNQLTFDPITGAYTFTDCATFTVTGTGRVTVKGCTVSLQHVAADRRVVAKVDFCTHRGSASAQTFTPLTRVKTITDRNTTNDTCGCVAAQAPPAAAAERAAAAQEDKKSP
ncbi:MAG TPA: hypothetical protein VKM94_06215 [Blastocatellia bacterium]|nr:hypothetical protein [Blastocatellia bacterium]